MIGQVEEFRAEFKPQTLGQLELLEEGEVQMIEARTAVLTGPPAEWAEVRLSNLSRHGRSREGRSVHPMTRGVRSGIQTDTWNLQGIAAEAGCRGNSATNSAGLAVLQGINPVGVPTAQERVDHLAGTQEVTVMPKGQFVDSAEMDHLVIDRCINNAMI